MPEKKFRALLIDELNPQYNETILEFSFGTVQNLILAKNKNKNPQELTLTQKLEKSHYIN